MMKLPHPPVLRSPDDRLPPPSIAGDPPDSEGEVITRQKAEVRQPRKFKVLMHNDDFTTMDFVMEVLMGVFNKSQTDAFQIMLQVHTFGVGVAGVYPQSVAETKIQEVHSRARTLGFPLLCTLEQE